MSDRAILVTGSYDYTIRFWDAYKEECTKYLKYGKDPKDMNAPKEVLKMLMTSKYNFIY